MKKETNELYPAMEQEVLDEFQVEELEERLEMSSLDVTFVVTWSY